MSRSWKGLSTFDGKAVPILAFYVEDGLERGAARCLAVLGYGGMGHTAGIHTRSREAATKYGLEMPASRICVNTPTTHGAIGFSTLCRHP